MGGGRVLWESATPPFQDGLQRSPISIRAFPLLMLTYLTRTTEVYAVETVREGRVLGVLATPLHIAQMRRAVCFLLNKPASIPYPHGLPHIVSLQCLTLEW